jgi:8-oxo-dGTP pyrophosphatase MutT (NUDIX family)
MSAKQFDYTQWCDSTGAPLAKMPDRLGVAANGFIRDKTGKILLQQRADNGFWGMPGGNVELGESVEQTAMREVYEETGLEVRVERLIGIYSEPETYPFMRYPDGTIVHYVTHVFICEPTAGALQLSSESTDIALAPHPHRGRADRPSVPVYSLSYVDCTSIDNLPKNKAGVTIRKINRVFQQSKNASEGSLTLF